MNVSAAEIVLPCAELDDTLAFFTDELGFRTAAVFPADDPTVFHSAVVTASGLYNPDVILLKLDLKLEDFDFRDVGVFNNDDQDKLVFEARQRVGYERAPRSGRRALAG